MAITPLTDLPLPWVEVKIQRTVRGSGEWHDGDLAFNSHFGRTNIYPVAANSLAVSRLFVATIGSTKKPVRAYGGIASGFVVESADANFYYSGDTALTQDMKFINETTKLKFAVLCVGGTLTMDADDAIRAAGLIQCKEVMGVHYDTFPTIKIDHAAAKEKFRSKELTLHLLPISGAQDF